MAKIFYCDCAYRELPFSRAYPEVLARLGASGCDLLVVADICRMAAHRDPRLKKVAREKWQIAACYPRAVRWLFHFAGEELGDVEIFNLREEEDRKTLMRFPAVKENPTCPMAAKDGSWVPWFPIIDYSRCKDCRQCLGFCLFGVYSLAGDRVVVANPQNCKTNCPACARICPEVAIVFPKLEESPINGAPVLDEETERGKVKVNLARMLGDDPYQALKKRREKVKLCLLEKTKLEQALKEREECAKKGDNNRTHDCPNCPKTTP